MPITLLEARHVGKRFGGLTALADVSLVINKGEIYGLIGPNGAGKTTFFNVLTGAYVPDGGEFVMNGAILPPGNRISSSSAGSPAPFRTSACSAN